MQMQRLGYKSGTAYRYRARGVHCAAWLLLLV